MYTTSVSTLLDDSAYIETDAQSNEASYLAQQSIDPTNRNRVQNESVVDQNRRQHPNNSLSTLSEGFAYIDNVTHPNPTRSEREFVSSENRPHEDESNSCTAEVASDTEKVNSPNQVSVVNKRKRQCRNNSLSVISEDSAYIDNVSHPNQTNSSVESMISSSCLNPVVNHKIGQSQSNCLYTHSESSAYSDNVSRLNQTRSLEGQVDSLIRQDLEHTITIQPLNQEDIMRSSLKRSNGRRNSASLPNISEGSVYTDIVK